MKESRGESQGNHPAATVQKPQRVAATKPQALPAALNAGGDPAMDPETQDPGTHHSPSRGPREPRDPGPGKQPPRVTRHTPKHPAPDTENHKYTSGQRHQPPAGATSPQTQEVVTFSPGVETGRPFQHQPKPNCHESPPHREHPHSVPCKGPARRHPSLRPQAQQGRHHRAHNGTPDPTLRRDKLTRQEAASTWGRCPPPRPPQPHKHTTSAPLQQLAREKY
ncbi:hypothetical protein CRENBAI_023972 [Crenichthys baileyi]|uniref:Uncharacterized protein n=1 Tax=Crenichthys baileyi TaxID=28760 RepID=A0AAV9SAU9_9TELE